MEIKDIRPDPAAPITPVRDDARQTPDRAASNGAGRGDDRIDISDEGRAMARKGDAASPEGTLPADRLLGVRRRVQSRFYDTPDVAEEVARRIIERGDL